MEKCRTEKLSNITVDWRMEHGLHAIVAQIDREMCIKLTSSPYRIA